MTLKRSEGPKRFIPSNDETRRGFSLWFSYDFRHMIQNGIDHFGWDDVTATAKAHEAVAIVLANLITVDPPTVHVIVKDSKVSITTVWPESQERH